jgi:hypothetical protein
MFAAGVPLVEPRVAGATGNIVYEGAVMKMREEVATGQRLQQAMANTGLFPNMVIQMIAVGEESGSLDSMSAKVADFSPEVDSPWMASRACWSRSSWRSRRAGGGPSSRCTSGLLGAVV